MGKSTKSRFSRVLDGSECVLAANIFDPLSARIASLLDYEVCFFLRFGFLRFDFLIIYFLII